MLTCPYPLLISSVAYINIITSTVHFPFTSRWHQPSSVLSRISVHCYLRDSWYIFHCIPTGQGIGIFTTLDFGYYDEFGIDPEDESTSFALSYDLVMGVATAFRQGPPPFPLAYWYPCGSGLCPWFGSLSVGFRYWYFLIFSPFVTPILSGSPTAFSVPSLFLMYHSHTPNYPTRIIATKGMAGKLNAEASSSRSWLVTFQVTLRNS